MIKEKQITDKFQEGTLYSGGKVSPGQDKPGGTLYPGVKCRRGQDTRGGGAR